MSQLPEVLVDRLRAGRCVLCAGAGLRTLASIPSWSGLLPLLPSEPGGQGETPARVAELKEMVRSGRLCLASGYIERNRSPDTFARRVSAALATPAELPEVLRLLGELPFRTIV